jgi:biotin carboxyl carrier protein
MTQIKEEQKDSKKLNYKSLLVESIRYKTLLTKKYEDKKPFERINSKIITAFIPGTIVEVFVKKNKRVKQGEKLLLLEAMKMKNEIKAPFYGVIKEINVIPGDKVNNKDCLIEFK